MDLLEQLGIDGKKLSMVRVTNGNGFVMRDRFDGILYTFKPNEPLVITHAAAMHFFGWPGDEMKLHTTKRFGWNTPAHIGADPNKSVDEMFHDGKTLADRYWENITIEQVNYSISEDQSLPEPEPEHESEDRPVPEPADVTRVGVGPKGRPRRLDL